MRELVFELLLRLVKPIAATLVGLVVWLLATGQLRERLALANKPRTCIGSANACGNPQASAEAEQIPSTHAQATPPTVRPTSEMPTADSGPNLMGVSVMALYEKVLR